MRLNGPHALHVRLAALVREIQEDDTIGLSTALGKLTSSAAHDVPGAQYAGITAVDENGGIHAATATHRYSALLDYLQQRYDQGPCLEAARQRHSVSVTDLVGDSRWPNFRAAALDATPVRSMICFDLSAGSQSFGALNLHAEPPHSFGAEAFDIAHTYSIHIAAVWNSLLRMGRIQSALRSRDIIGQAEGMLMHRFGISADEAFVLLERLATSAKLPLDDICTRLALRREVDPGDL